MRIDPRDANALSWFFNDALGEFRPSLHTSIEDRPQYLHPLKRPNHLNGGHESDVIYIHSAAPSLRPPELPDEDDHSFRVATAERRIRERLVHAGPKASEILRLRFREVLPPCRFPFGLEGEDLREKKGKPRPRLTMFAVRLTLRRGHGAVAHLTPAAIAAYAYAKEKGALRDIAAWVDQLGARLDHGGATPSQRMLGAQIAREALALVLWAWRCYRAAAPRPRGVPGKRTAA